MFTSCKSIVKGSDPSAFGSRSSPAASPLVISELAVVNGSAKAIEVDVVLWFTVLDVMEEKNHYCGGCLVSYLIELFTQAARRLRLRSKELYTLTSARKERGRSVWARKYSTNMYRGELWKQRSFWNTIRR